MKLSLPSLTLAAAIGWTDAYVPKTPLHFASTVRPLAQIPSSLSLSLSHRGSNDDGHDNNDDGCTSRRKSRMERIRSFGQLLSERTDTFAAAGFYDDGELQEDFSSALEDPPPSKLSRRDWTIPLHAGVFKSGIQIAIAVWLFKKAKKASFVRFCQFRSELPLHGAILPSHPNDSSLLSPSPHHALPFYPSIAHWWLTATERG